MTPEDELFPHTETTRLTSLGHLGCELIRQSPKSMLDGKHFGEMASFLLLAVSRGIGLSTGATTSTECEEETRLLFRHGRVPEKDAS